MRHRRQDSFKQRLARLLRRGRREKAIELVRDTLAKEPTHASALNEWHRLQAGQPFTYEEVEQKKKQGHLQYLETILTNFSQNPAQLAVLNRSVLKKRLSQLRTALKKVGGIEGLEPATSEQYRLYLNALTKEIKRRRRTIRGKSLLGLSLIAGLGLVGACSMALIHRAHEAADALEQVWQNHELQPDYADSALRTYDTGFNRMLDRRVGNIAERISFRIQNQSARIKQAIAVLSEIQRGNGKLAELSIAERVEIQDTCRIQSKESLPLIALWNTLYLREKEQMERLKSVHIADLLAPLPPMQALSGLPQQDLPILEKRLDALQLKKQRFKELSSLYKLDKKDIIYFTKEHKHISSIKKELEQFRTCLQTLSAAHDYQGYRDLLRKGPDLQQYIAGQHLLSATEALPSKQDFQRAMQMAAAQDIPEDFIPAAIRTLVYEGSSISEKCPATREQLQTMENIFALSGAPVALYQIINKDNEVCYSESQPQIKDKHLVFQRSVYDPLRPTGDISTISWKNPHEIWIKIIDLRPLWKACGFDKPQQFFNTAHFPSLLSIILNTEAPHCPALARAYLYHKISELMRQHSPQALAGFGYTPTMKQHIEEFEQLRKQCNIPLLGMCWLRQTPDYIAAEHAFTRWFRKHKGFSYEKEIKKHAGERLLLHAQFCGYVNEYGKPVFRESHAAGTKVWYADKGQVHSFCLGDDMPQLPGLSPLFIAKKVTPQQYQP